MADLEGSLLMDATTFLGGGIGATEIDTRTIVWAVLTAGIVYSWSPPFDCHLRFAITSSGASTLSRTGFRGDTAAAPGVYGVSGDEILACVFSTNQFTPCNAQIRNGETLYLVSSAGPSRLTMVVTVDPPT